MSSTFKNDWKEFKKNPKNYPFIYDSTVDLWSTDLQLCKIIILDMLAQFGHFQPNKEEIAKMFSFQYTEVWKQAFTTHYKIDIDLWKQHRRIKTEQNYETLELIGDAVSNQIVAQYMYYRFPDLFGTNKYFPRLVYRIDAHLHSDAMWKVLAADLGLHRLLRYDIFLYSKDDQVKNHIDFDDFIADVFEAFIGAASLVLNKLHQGLGYAVCTNILYSFFNKQHIPTDIETYTDNVTKFNDIHKSSELPYDILFRLYGTGKENQHFVIHLLILEKDSTVPELKDDFVNSPTSYQNEPGYKMFSSYVSKEDLFSQVMPYLQQEYGIAWSNLTKAKTKRD